MSADELSIKLTAKDALSDKLKTVRGEIKGVESELVKANRRLIETGQGADEFDKLRRRLELLRKEQSSTAKGIGSLNREIRGTGREGAQSFDKATRSLHMMNRAGRGVESTMHRVRGSTIVAGTAIGSVFGTLIVRGLAATSNGLRSVIAGTLGYQKLQKQTEAVIKSTGNTAGLTVRGIDGLASSLESLSGVDEKTIIGGENVLATFTSIRNAVGKGNDVFDQATKAALDMSVALGQDLQGSVIQIGKALNDPVRGITALRKVGVSFTKQQEKQIATLVKSGNALGAQKVILAELNKEFGGQAKAAGQTFEGSLARAKDSVGDFARSLLTPALPYLTKGLDKGAKFVERFQSELAKGSKGKFGPFLTDLKTRGQALYEKFRTQLLPAIMEFARSAMPVIVSAVRGFATILTNVVIPVLSRVLEFLARHKPLLIAVGIAITALVIGPVTALIAAVALIVDNWDLVGPAVLKCVGVAGAGVLGFGQMILDGVLSPLRTLLKVASHLPGPLGHPFKKAVGLIDDLDDSIDGLQNKLQHLGDKPGVVHISSIIDDNFATSAKNRNATGVATTRTADKVVKAATGGLITGPGTATSDSIRALLSNGEYVVKAAAVSSVGVGFLDRVNNADRASVPKSSPLPVQRIHERELVGAGGPLIGEYHSHVAHEGIDVRMEVLAAMRHAKAMQQERS